jgi:hypothetical protein
MRYRLLIAAVMTAGACVVGAPEAQASSHREAPFVTKNPKIDSTDFYAFKSFEPGRDGYITIIANYLPLQDAYGGPNYFSLDPEALYEIHVDNNADGGEDITFQFQFKNTLNAGAGAGQCANCNLPVSLLPAAGGAAVVKTNNVSLLAVGGIGPATTNTGAQHVLETYTVNMVKGDRRTGAVTALGTTFKKPIDNIGTTTLGDFNAYDTYANNHITQFDIPGCTPPVGTKPRVFVGQRAEGFAANIGVIFDLLQTGNTGFFNAITQSDGAASPTFTDSLAGRGRNSGNIFDIGRLNGKNVTSIAIEVPQSCLVAGTQPILGLWTSASMRQARVLNPAATFDLPAKEGGAWVQVSRLGMPLVNEVVIGLKDKDKFGGSAPKDTAQFADYVTHPTLPKLIEVLHGALGASAPKKVRDDLVATFGQGLQVTVDAPALGSIAFTKNTSTGVFEYLRLNTRAELGGATSRANQLGKGVAQGLGALGCFKADRHVDASLTTCDLQGFPNGRRPGDDVVDITLRVAMGVLFPSSTDAPNNNIPFTDVNFNGPEQFGETFPYLNVPHSGNGVY